ncbi:hypothetical protein [Phenylobacterium sp.]|uniref:hypothetical protein n=1 Tax=Phenylobacterium sp. TaxID=1871053 RepID=UPI0035699BE7
MFDRRSLSVWKFLAAAWGGVLAVMLATRLLFPTSSADVGTSRVMITTLAAAIATGWGLWMAVLAFRRLDEFQQEAGKFAWYWGGAIGLGVSGVGYAFIGLGGLHWLDPAHFHLGKDLFRAFQIGYLLGVGCPFLGFLVARLYWTAAKR